MLSYLHAGMLGEVDVCSANELGHLCGSHAHEDWTHYPSSLQQYYFEEVAYKENA